MHHEIYVIFNKLTYSSSIIMVTGNLIQFIFIGFGILDQLINKPLSTSHIGYNILNKCNVPQIKAA